MQTDTSSEQAIDEESAPSTGFETWDRIKHTEWFVFAAATLFAVVFPYLFAGMPVLSDTILHSSGRYSIAQAILLWMIFALSFNLLLGQTGLLSFGHAMFWAWAGYGGAWFAINFVAEPFLIVVAGTLLAIILAAGTAFILLRLHTVYFSIVTLAIAQFLYWLANSSIQDLTVHYIDLLVIALLAGAAVLLYRYRENASLAIVPSVGALLVYVALARSTVTEAIQLGSLDLGTGGSNGRRISTEMEPLFFMVDLNMPLAEPFATLWNEMLYVFLAVFFVGTVVFITRVRKSPYGLLFKAIRENETRASFVGLNVWRYKFAAYVLSGAIAGLAGVLRLINTGSITGSRGYWQVGGDIVMTTVMGGLGTLVGPLLGSFVYYYFNAVVSGFETIPLLGIRVPIVDVAFGRLWLMMLAITFTAVVWLYPTGLWGMITAATGKLRGTESEGGDH